MLFALWLLWSGHYTVMITSFGVASVLLCLWLAHRMGIIDEESHPLHLAMAHITYGPWLLWQIVLASLDVTKRVITNDISPRWVRIKAPQRTAVGRVIYANSITLTPGTTSIRLDGDQLLVHTIHKDVGEDLAGGAMAKRVCQLEGSN